MDSDDPHVRRANLGPPFGIRVVLWREREEGRLWACFVNSLGKPRRVELLCRTSIVTQGFPSFGYVEAESLNIPR